MLFEKYGMDNSGLFHIQPFKMDRFPIHFHRAYEFIRVIEGSMSMNIDGSEYILGKGECLIVFPNQLHDIRIQGQRQIEILIFAPEMINSFHKEYKGLVPVVNSFTYQNKRPMDSLHNFYDKKAYLYDLCAQMVEELNFHPISHIERNKLLYEMLMYVEENYSKECNLKIMSKDLGYDYGYLSKAFVQLMGMTFTEYLNHYRISNALDMLNNPSNSISDIAYQCGFNNFRTFNRNFKLIQGKSPTEYLRSV